MKLKILHTDVFSRDLETRERATHWRYRPRIANQHLARRWRRFLYNSTTTIQSTGSSLFLFCIFSSVHFLYQRHIHGRSDTTTRLHWWDLFVLMRYRLGAGISAYSFLFEISSRIDKRNGGCGENLDSMVEHTTPCLY